MQLLLNIPINVLQVPQWSGLLGASILIITVTLLMLLSFFIVYASACPVCYLPVEEAVALMPKIPSASPVLKKLTYIYEENLSRDGEFGGSDFGGYPTLKQRNDSFDIRESMSVHCGYAFLLVVKFSLSIFSNT